MFVDRTNMDPTLSHCQQLPETFRKSFPGWLDQRDVPQIEVAWGRSCWADVDMSISSPKKWGDARPGDSESFGLFRSAVPRCRGAARPAGDPCTDTSGPMVRSGAPAVTGRCGPPHRSPIRSRGPAGRAVPRGGCMPRRQSGPGPCGRQCVRSVAVCRFGQHADDELGYRVDLPPCRGQPLGKSEGVQPAGVVRAVRSVCEHHMRGAGRDRCRSSTFSTSSDRQDCTRGNRRAAAAWPDAATLGASAPPQRSGPDPEQPECGSDSATYGPHIKCGHLAIAKSQLDELGLRSFCDVDRWR